MTTKLANTPNPSTEAGAQRLSAAQLQNWEALGYGMFIHFGISRFLGKEIPAGEASATAYGAIRSGRGPVGRRRR